MSKSFLRSRRIWLLTIGFFCKLWERTHSSEGRGIGGRCGLWYPFRRPLQDLGGGRTGVGWGGTGRSGWLGWLRLPKCWTWQAGTPAEASASSSPLLAPGEARIRPVIHLTVALAYLGREG